MDLKNQRVVLTGAASGIGKALLEALSLEPLSLIAADLDATRLHEVCAALPGNQARVIPMQADVSSQAGNDMLFETALREFGGVDLWIANAGFAYFEHARQGDWARLERLFHLNTLAPIYTLERLAALNSGRAFKMVWVASAMAHIGLPRYAAYSASKAALHRFAEAHRDSMPDPRALMLVYPIATRTRFFERAGEHTPLPSPNQTPEAVAEAIIAGIRRDALEVYPSRLFQTMLWLSLWLPGLRRFIQVREMQRAEG